MVNPTLRGYIPITLEEAGLGFLLGTAAAIVLAVFLASSKLASEVADPFISVLNSVPKIILAPLFLLIFGLGLISKVYFVSVGIFFIPFFALYRAITTVDPVYLEHARILGASKWRIAKDVYVPAVIGATTSSLRIAVSFALLTALLAEFVASNAGIGYGIDAAETSVQPGLLIAGILIVAIIGFIVDRLLLLAELRFSHWRVA